MLGVGGIEREEGGRKGRGEEKGKGSSKVQLR